MSKRTWNRITPTPVKRDAANISWLTDTLATGGDLSYLPWIRRAQVQEILDAGITHIIDMRIEDDDYDLWESHGIQYINLGTEDRVGHVVSSELFDESVAFARLADEMGGKVLAHCHMGINRGPSAGFAVLLTLGWDPVVALAAIRAARPIAHIWYAEDALAWHFDRNAVPAEERRAVLARVAQWREENPLDVVRIIRDIRASEAS